MHKAVTKKILEKISQDPFARFMGIELLELRDGYSRLAMTLKDSMLNFHGIAHGGAIFSLADAAFAAASNSHGQIAIALSMNINYRHAVKAGTKLFAEAREESLGKRTALYRMTVTTEDGKLVASSYGTVYRKDEKFINV
jgi:acyl-CoA thioesterase